MEMGRNNRYKPKKQSVVAASFLKVKIMGHFTAIYSELAESIADIFLNSFVTKIMSPVSCFSSNKFILSLTSFCSSVTGVSGIQ
jgi:hypothetical protein